MAKDPAVLWYWNDWNGGTMTFTRHLKGCYMDLLSAQFNSGPLSLEEIKTILGSDFSAWNTLQKKFKQNPQGLFFNERLLAEKTKRQNFTESRRNNFKGDGEKTHMNQHMKPHMGSHTDNRMENVNENDIANKIKNENVKKKRSEKKSKEETPMLFRESPIFDKSKFQEAFIGTKYENAHLDYYHEAALNWSDSKNNKKTDWTATVRNFMLKDLREGKFVTQDFNPNAKPKHSGTTQEQIIAARERLRNN